jgi:hypothetical protein
LAYGYGRDGNFGLVVEVEQTFLVLSPPAIHLAR